MTEQTTTQPTTDNRQPTTVTFNALQTADYSRYDRVARHQGSIRYDYALG